MQLLVTVIVALPLLNRAALGDYGAAVAQNFVSAAFIKDEVVPDAIDTAPKQLLNVNFDSVVANLGKELMVAQVQTQPNVSWTPSGSQLQTLVFIDPDALGEGNKSRTSVLHWLVCNIPAASSDVTRGQTYTEFLGSGPWPNTGFHRYVMLAYPQVTRLHLEPLANQTSFLFRYPFDLRNFSATHQIRMDFPIAGNFYVAKAGT